MRADRRVAPGQIRTRFGPGTGEPAASAPQFSSERPAPPGFSKRNSSSNADAALSSPTAMAYIASTMAKAKTDPNYKVIAENRRARYDYAIEDDLECGIMLQGSEVKSLRENGANIAESYASVEDGELWLVNGYVPPFEQARTWGHDERRRRKLLVSRKEMARLWSDTQRKGFTLVPLVLYFNHKGLVKLKIGIAKGKKTQDKRDTEAKRDWQRQKARLLKDHG